MNAFRAAQCPLCGELNRCAMEIERQTSVAQPNCWCMQVDFSAELLASVPSAAKNNACICETCARASAADTMQPDSH